MAEHQEQLNPTEEHVPSTAHKRAPIGALPGSAPKRPPTRSSAKAATDFLHDENRIGSNVHYPHKKRRYVVLHIERMMTGLIYLYSLSFKHRWNYFRHVENRLTLPAGVDAYTYLAIVYLSHWLSDTYRTLRTCLEITDPIAFTDRFMTQVGSYSEIYDTFLSTLNAHLRPTHIVNAVSDAIYIPLFTRDTTTSTRISTFWKRFQLNSDIFYLILDTITDKKLMSMTPLSSDIAGRPSWLFDWSQDSTAFAWFPQEGNYTDEDVAVAYIIGDACSPKLGLADHDDWKYTDTPPSLDNQYDIDHYTRVTPRRWYGNSEFRTAETEPVNIPLYKEKDEAKKTSSNYGPLQIYSKITAGPRSKDSQSTSSTDIEIDEVESQTAPPSPRYQTRAAKAPIAEMYRVRVTDRIYYKQVILYMDNTSRFSAFKVFSKFTT